MPMCIRSDKARLKGSGSSNLMYTVFLHVYSVRMYNIANCPMQTHFKCQTEAFEDTKCMRSD